MTTAVELEVYEQLRVWADEHKTNANVGINKNKEINDKYLGIEKLF